MSRFSALAAPLDPGSSLPAGDTQQTIRLFIVDDHAILRGALRALLSQEVGIEVVDDAGSAEQAGERLSAGLQTDLILLDLSLPGKNGVDFLRQLKTDYPHIAVLVLSMHPERTFAVRVMREGASGYVPKTADPTELLKAIRMAGTGRKYVNAAVAELLVSNMDESTELSHNLLSARELQIFLRIARGMAPGSMAQELGLSVKTISTYRARILEKMNISSNAEIAAYAVRNQILE